MIKAARCRGGFFCRTQTLFVLALAQFVLL